MKDNKVLLFPLSEKKTLGMSSSNRRVEIASNIEETHKRFSEIFKGEASEETHKNFGKAYEAVMERNDQVRFNKCIRLIPAGDKEFSEHLEKVISNYPKPDLNGREINVVLYCLNDDNSNIDLSVIEKIDYDYVLPVCIRRYEIQAGPLIMGDTEECTLNDLRDRRLAIAVSPKHELAMKNSPKVLGDKKLVEENHIFLLVENILELGSEIFKIKSKIISVSLEDCSVKIRDLHALPSSTNKRPRRSIYSLIDKDHGIIQQTRVVKHHRSVPSRLWTVQADASDMTRVSPWHTNTNCQGSSFDDLEGATLAAIGESAERYCGNILDSLPRIFSSWNKLSSKNISALDPRKVVMYGEEQYSNPKFPIEKLSIDKDVSWVPGKNITTGQQTWIPSSLVYVNYVFGQFENEPVVNMPSFPGIAAGTTEEMAIISGIQEIVERNATMVWWHNAIKLPKLKLPQSLLDIWKNSDGQIFSAMSLPNEFDIPVIAGIVEYPEEKLFNIGFAARGSYVSAVKKAWSEALTLQEGSRDLLEPNGLFRQAFATGRLNGAAMKPYREDRLYMDSYRDDFRDVSDLQCQQQFYLDPRAREKISHIVDTDIFQSFPNDPLKLDGSLESYKRCIEEKGYEIYVVNITTPDIKSAGLEVVRVVIPGLVPNFSAAFPALGIDRLKDDPVRLGIFKNKLETDEMNWYPLPHA